MPGRFLPARSFAEEAYSDRPASVVCNNAGMNGSEGAFQRHGQRLDTMWLTTHNPGNHNVIWFDLGSVMALGEMYIWNFNQPGFSGAGLRDVRLFTSFDGRDWNEFRGSGYPYRFAKAGETPLLRATNLDMKGHPPVDFNGCPARYVKIVPDERLGVGNWGEYISGEHRYGLSAVRFYAYRPTIKKGGYIPARVFAPDNQETADELVNGHGLSDPAEREALYNFEQSPGWISCPHPWARTLIFDLEGTYPIDEMWIWNHAEKGGKCAIKGVRIYHSIDKATWTELKGEGYPYIFQRPPKQTSYGATNLLSGEPVRFHNALLRYVKIELAGGAGEGTWDLGTFTDEQYGLAQVRFYAGEGYCAESERQLDAKFSHYQGWSGADGFFTAALDGTFKKVPPGKAIPPTVALFSDTLLGESDPVTRRRSTLSIVNNTAARITGRLDNLQIRYQYREAPGGKITSLLLREAGGFYWLQDCVVIGDKLYCFTHNIETDNSKTDGFPFRIVGVDLLSFSIVDGSVDYDHPSIQQTDLYLPDPMSQERRTYFGCCLLPNTEASGAEHPDGYIYIYGIRHRGMCEQDLLAARVPEKSFDNLQAIEFFDGKQFQSDIHKSAALCVDAGTEMSLTPIRSGPYAGRYCYVYTKRNVGNKIYVRIADSPIGPFGDEHMLYYTDETEHLLGFGGREIYAYNAKAQYSLSQEGELLISYNINTLDFETHIINCELYKPRFIKVRRLS